MTKRDPLSAAVAMIWILGAGSWLTWPIWQSLTVPDLRTQLELTGWVLAAMFSWLLLLGWTLCLGRNRQLGQLSPIALHVMAAVFLRLAVNPDGAGIELALAAPYLAGLVLGAPAGVLTGALSAAASALATDTVAAPLPGQMLVWALWGLAGGLLHNLPRISRWIAAILLAPSLGVLSGVLLNLTGWATTPGVEVGSFIPGLDPIPQLQALWEFTVDTSLTWDITRGLTLAVLVAAVGLPWLRMLDPDTPHRRSP